MKTKPESAPTEARSIRDEPRPNNLRITRDFRDRDVFVTHSRSTR